MYNRFEVNKRSNRASALHIRYKLATMGLDYVPAEEADGNDDLLQSKLSEAELLAQMVAEHDRWQAFHESEGWRTATVEQVETYKQAGLSGGTHKCPLLRLHPYICDFSELKTRSEQLGLEDSTVYDRSLIENIPAILSGKRRGQEKARRGFQIVERTR